MAGQGMHSMDPRRPGNYERREKREQSRSITTETTESTESRREGRQRIAWGVSPGRDSGSMHYDVTQSTKGEMNLTKAQGPWEGT